jgi:hypothetical protein
VSFVSATLIDRASRSRHSADRLADQVLEVRRGPEARLDCDQVRHVAHATDEVDRAFRGVALVAPLDGAALRDETPVDVGLDLVGNPGVPAQLQRDRLGYLCVTDARRAR